MPMINNKLVVIKHLMMLHIHKDMRKSMEERSTLVNLYKVIW